MALCQRAYDNDVRILVDAEDYCFQDAIDALTDEAMRKFNKKRAIVFATLQMYRHDGCLICVVSTMMPWRKVILRA